ncbi:cytochrome c oxidase assembly protein CtaG/Cox11, partial [Pelagophyceae sp. CCMP2097]
DKNVTTAVYGVAIVVATCGMAYASVPLYKVFCQTTGFGGTTKRVDPTEALRLMKPVKDGRVLRITFDGHVSDALPWTFTPAQRDVRITPGETALAFYTTKNNSDHAITGVASYNVQPPQAGFYFNKIQCFCFDEQRLRAGEEVDMPVFFVIDPRYNDDPALKRVNNITLSYNFFKTGDD